jgi:lysophospholipase L1-like esterase
LTRPVRLGLAVLAVVVLLLASAEGFARVVWSEPPPQAWHNHLLVGFVRAPNFKARKLAFDTLEPFTYETNRLGFRSTSLDEVSKKPGVFRIVFLGGSTTENGDLPHESTFPGIVEKALRARPDGARFEVANAGVPGATTNVVLAQLVHRVLPLQPDLVVCLDPVLNDFHESLRPRWGLMLEHMTADAPRPRLMDWLAAQSRFLGHFNTRNAEPPNARELLRRRVAVRKSIPENDPPPGILARGRAHHEGVQRLILEVCRDEKVACALVTEPILLKPSMSKEEDDVVASTAITGTATKENKTGYNLRVATELAALEAYNETTRRNAAAFGALLVDADRSVPKNLEHYVDDVHRNKKGNEVIAAAILEAIAPVLSR